MRTFAPALLALALCCAPLCAQQPPPPSIDTIADQIADLRKQRAALDAREAALVNDLRAEFKRLADKIDKLGLVNPPTPTPPAPPAPVDALKVKLKAAFDGDTAPLDTRKGQALDLAALYRQAATLTADPAVASAGELLARVRDAARALVGADALKELRKVAGAELGALLPTDAPLSTDQRTATAALFTRLATALEEIAK